MSYFTVYKNAKLRDHDSFVYGHSNKVAKEDAYSRDFPEREIKDLMTKLGNK